jgi:hypothetical protein
VTSFFVLQMVLIIDVTAEGLGHAAPVGNRCNGAARDVLGSRPTSTSSSSTSLAATWLSAAAFH